MLSGKGRVLHPELTKLDLHFYDLSTIFNEFSKFQLKPKKTITSRTLEKLFVITQQPLVYGKHLRKIEEDTIGSPVVVSLAGGDWPAVRGWGVA
jgi:hypothetical protein